MVQGQESVPNVLEAVANGIASSGALGGIFKRRGYDDDTTSRGVFDEMLKQRGYGRSGMLHTHVASSRCSSI
jgi:hypothetical protein